MNLRHVGFLNPPLILGVIAVIVAVLAVFLWWWLPKWQVNRLRRTIRDPKARADVEDNFRKTIGQLLGGAAVLIGAGLAYMQFSQQQQTSTEQFSRQQQASRDLLISNQVSKGFEQLGSDKVVMRLGGIYALEGVMNTSDQYHQAVLEALSAFVRDGTKNETGDGPPMSDIQAALTVIGRRARIAAAVPNLANAHIPKAYLRGPFLYSSMGEEDNPAFSQMTPAALPRGGDLRGADLSGTDLRGADLSGADLDNADMTDANLSGASLVRANLRQAQMIRTDLTGARLLFGTNLNRARLIAANLSDATLIGANLSSANLSGANLSDANLSDANLSDANLSDANLGGANLGSATDLTQTQLISACGNADTKLPKGLTVKPCRTG